MKKEVLFIGLFFAVLFVLPLVVANTEVNVRTLSNHKVSVFFLKDLDAYALAGSARTVSGDDGIATVSYEGDDDAMKISVKVSDNSTGKRVMFEAFEAFPTGAPIYLQVMPGAISSNYKADDDARAAKVNNAAAPVPDVNESEEEVAPEGSAGVTGNVVKGESEGIGINISSSVYYIIGGILAALIVAFIVLKTDIVRRDPAYKYKSVNLSKGSKTLEDAENKIKEAQAEINKLKGQDKIAQAEKKLEDDKKKLEALKKGDADDKDKLEKWEDDN